IQSIYKYTAESKTLWQPVFGILLSDNLDGMIKPEMRQSWARKFNAESQVYFFIWDSSGNQTGAISIISAVEIYSISNASIVREIGTEDHSSLTSTFPMRLIETRTQRRLDFRKAVIIGINVDDVDYEASTKYKNTNGSGSIEFEGGFEVLEFWYLRHALNFT
ncbi:unnamed protein product, partial [Allacma fusca]